MGAIAPSKMPRGRTTVKRDGAEPVGLFKKVDGFRRPLNTPAHLRPRQKRLVRVLLHLLRKKPVHLGVLANKLVWLKH
jgi:hypothetical protein